ncbi:MAG: diguanylate cyclase (GGDEF)-like protein, partial [Verrucomicrobiales bacterium]
HAVVVSCAVALLAVALPTSAAAGDVGIDSPEAEALEAIDGALIAVADELAYAEMSGLLNGTSPARVVALGETLGLGRPSDDVLSDRFLEVDETLGPKALDELVSLGLVVSPAVRAVLESGTVIPKAVNFEVYVVAYSDLMRTRGRRLGRPQVIEDDFADLLPVALPLRAPAGLPPERLLQADTEGLGRTLVAPQAATTSGLPLDVDEPAIYGRATAILLGLLVITLVSRRRRTRHGHEALGPLVEQAYQSITVHQETAALVFVDDLTGIANRRRFDSDVEVMMDVAAHERTPVSIAMFDVDHLKSFNDNNGHVAGDEVLRSVAELIASNLRSSDVVYRYGGEEFVALLPGADVDDAYEVVERIREVVERTEFEGEATQPSGCVTLSVGIAVAPLDESTNVVHAADMALHEAKMSGRNRVVIEASLT